MYWFFIYLYLSQKQSEFTQLPECFTCGSITVTQLMIFSTVSMGQQNIWLWNTLITGEVIVNKRAENNNVEIMLVSVLTLRSIVKPYHVHQGRMIFCNSIISGFWWYSVIPNWAPHVFSFMSLMEIDRKEYGHKLFLWGPYCNSTLGMRQWLYCLNVTGDLIWELIFSAAFLFYLIRNLFCCITSCQRHRY